MSGDRSDTKEGQPEPGARLTFNGLFDALAKHWSVRYRDAQKRGASVSYDMSEATLTGDDDCAWRQPLAAGVNVEAIWALLIRQTAPPKKPSKKPLPPPHPRLARLYTLRCVRGHRYSPSRKVQLHEGQLLDDLRYAILRDPQYERPARLRLLLANAKAPELPTRQSVCEGRPYDVVNPSPWAKDVLSILESARFRFYIEQFREDFEALDEFRRTHTCRPSRKLVVQRCAYDRVEQTVRGPRQIYEQTAGFTDLPRDGQGRADVVIRSRFFRSLNRRFNAADFWPEHVAGDLRERWFGPAGQQLDTRAELPFIERDVSSSQTQILAVFLSLPGLEALATDPAKKFIDEGSLHSICVAKIVIDRPTSTGRYIDPVDAFVYRDSVVAIFYEFMRR